MTTAPARPPSKVTLGLLVVLGLINLARGAIHVFLPDSGAGVIAHFDLAQGGRTIVFLLAMIGAGQIGAGLIDLLSSRGSAPSPRRCWRSNCCGR